jgi:hypothetical protein
MEYIVTSIRKAGILEAALFTRQRIPTTHLVESISVATELWYKMLSIQSAKRLLKGEHSKVSSQRLESAREDSS